MWMSSSGTLNDTEKPILVTLGPGKVLVFSDLPAASSYEGGQEGKWAILVASRMPSSMSSKRFFKDLTSSWETFCICFLADAIDASPPVRFSPWKLPWSTTKEMRTSPTVDHFCKNVFIHSKSWAYAVFVEHFCTGIILGMGSANETSPTGWAHTQNNPCYGA